MFSPAHHHLLELGYVHTHNEADWEDDGDAESGPHLSGGPAYDEYYVPGHSIYVEENGTIHQETRDPDEDRFIERMSPEMQGEA